MTTKQNIKGNHAARQLFYAEYQSYLSTYNATLTVAAAQKTNAGNISPLPSKCHIVHSVTGRSDYAQ